MITFINFVKRFLAGGGTKSRVGASRGVGGSVRALLLLMLNLFARPWAPASLSCSLAESNGGLAQKLRQAQDLRAIATELKSKERDAVLPNGLADPLGIELLKL